MVRVHYRHNNRIVEKDVYETARIFHCLCTGEQFPEPSYSSDEQVSGSTSGDMDDEDEAPSINGDEDVAVEVEEVVEVVAPVVIPALAVIMNIIGARSPPWEKRLTKSDVSEGQGRLIVRKEFVTNHLLPMLNADEDPSEGIDVTVYNGEGRQYDMQFKLWASKLYVLTKGWNDFYKTNNLTEPGLYITLWMFRHVETHKLCFAVTPGQFGEP